MLRRIRMHSGSPTLRRIARVRRPVRRELDQLRYLQQQQSFGAINFVQQLLLSAKRQRPEMSRTFQLQK